MMYEQLVKALRSASTVLTAWGKLMLDAAAAIEELDAEETRLLLITSELQDKVVELEGRLTDAEIAADDNGRQVEELQAEVKRLELDNEDYEHEQRRLKGEIEALQAETERLLHGCPLSRRRRKHEP